MKSVIILCMIMLWSNQSIVGQSLNTALISKDTIAVQKKSFEFLQGNAKDGTTALKSLFYFYKHFISSQDAQACRFTPSCSEFAFLSIKKHGVVMGIIDFFDRFARCNPLSSENYAFDPDKHCYKDPVE